MTLMMCSLYTLIKVLNQYKFTRYLVYTIYYLKNYNFMIFFLLSISICENIIITNWATDTTNFTASVLD